MGIQSSNTDKELKKNNFETANHADTIQPKSIDGLQNHADTQKLIRVKTAAEQSNRHEKLTQFKTAAEQSNRHEKLTQFKTAAEQSNRQEKLTQLQSMGDARAQKIQNGGVVQFGGKTDLLKSAGKAAMEAGGGAARIGARGVGGAAIFKAGNKAVQIVKPQINTVSKILAGLVVFNEAVTIADQSSDFLVSFLVDDKKRAIDSAISLMGIGMSKVGLPPLVKQRVEKLLEYLSEFVTRIEFEENAFDSTIYKKINEDFTLLGNLFDKETGLNIADTCQKLDNIASRFKAVTEQMIGNANFVVTNREDVERDRIAASAATDAQQDIMNPEIAALLQQNAGASDSEVFEYNDWQNSVD
jgi:hypothetical protein